MHPINNKTIIQLIAITFISIIFNYYFSSLYVNGDQVFYRNFYNEIEKYNYVEGFVFYQGALSSIEPTYYTLTFFASRYIEKDLYIAIANTILTACIFIYLKRYKAKWWIYPLVFSNFYLMVLFFSAERLKFGAIFFFLYALSVNIKWKRINLTLGILSHIQIFIAALTIFTTNTFKKKNQSAELFSVNKGTALGFIVALTLILALWNQLAYKIPFYIQNSGIENIIKPLLISLITYMSALKKDRKNALIAHTPIIVGCIVLGTERLVMFSFIIMFYYFIRLNKPSAPAIIVSTYFSITGFIFLIGILTRGTGFSI